MGQPTLSIAAELALLKATYAALNRNDIPAMVAALDPRIEWIEPPEYSGGGTWRGLAAVERHLAEARGRWAEGACTPRRYIAAGDKVVVFLDIRVRMKGQADWIVGDTTDVYVFENGRPVRMRTFATWDEALEWAGIAPGQSAAQPWPE